MHVPLFDPRENFRTPYMGLKNREFAEKLNELFEKYNITMVFASHIHGYWRGMWGKTPYIITGGAGAELLGVDPNHYFYHYIKVDVGKNVTCEVKKLSTPPYDFLDRIIHDFGIYAYAFFAMHYLGIIIFIVSLYLSLYAIIFIRNKVSNRKNNV